MYLPVFVHLSKSDLDSITSPFLGGNDIAVLERSSASGRRHTDRVPGSLRPWAAAAAAAILPGKRLSSRRTVRSPMEAVHQGLPSPSEMTLNTDDCFPCGLSGICPRRVCRRAAGSPRLIATRGSVRTHNFYFKQVRTESLRRFLTVSTVLNGE